MISTTCPGCSAKFQVPENLVSGKTVRFRCRKCGGPIEVDGTKASGEATEAAASKPETAGRQRKATLLFGGGTSENASKPAVATAQVAAPVQPKIEEAKPGKAQLFDLALTPPPPDTDDLWDLPPEAVTIQPKKASSPKSEDAKPASATAQGPKPADALVQQAAKPTKSDEAKAATKRESTASQPAAPEPTSDGKASPELPLPPRSAEAGKTAARADKLAPQPSSKPVPSSKPAPSPASVRKSGLRNAFGLDEPGKDKPAPASDKKPAPASDKKPAPASDKKPAPASDKKPAPASDKKPAILGGAEGKSPDSAKPSTPKPGTARPAAGEARSDATLSKRSRASMELGGVFGAKDKGATPEKPAPSDHDDLDVEVDLEDNLELKPLVIRTDGAKAPPAPQLKKVVIDLADVGGGAPPEARALPSVAFFSPVLVQQAQLATPPVSLGPTEQQKSEAHKSRNGAMWAAIIAGVGVLCAAGILLWKALESREPAPTRSGAAADTTTEVASLPAPQTGVRGAEPTPAATAEPSAAPGASPEPTGAASAAATAGAATAGAEPTAKVTSTQGKEPAAGPAKPGPTAEANAAPAETAKQPDPAKPEVKQPEPAPASNEVPFDKAAAAASLAARKGAAAGCKQEGGPTGHAKVSVTFAPSGRVTTANINGPPFAGTPVGGCIASKFRGATVPPFTGSPVTVHTSVAIF